MGCEAVRKEWGPKCTMLNKDIKHNEWNKDDQDGEGYQEESHNTHMKGPIQEHETQTT